MASLLRITAVELSALTTVVKVGLRKESKKPTVWITSLDIIDMTLTSTCGSTRVVAVCLSKYKQGNRYKIYLIQDCFRNKTELTRWEKTFRHMMGFLYVLGLDCIKSQ